MRMIIHRNAVSPLTGSPLHWCESPGRKHFCGLKESAVRTGRKGGGGSTFLGVLEGLGFAKLHLPVRAENVKSCVLAEKEALLFP